MGLYVSEANIRTMMPQFSVETSGSSAYSLTTDIINKAIARAEGLVNGYVSRKYRLPFTTVPVQIREESLALAVAYTYKYHYAPDHINRNEFYESFKEDENNAIENLKAIADGKLQLTLTDGTLLPYASGLLGVHTNMGNFQPIFDMDSATAWKVDEDYLDEVRDAR